MATYRERGAQTNERARRAVSEFRKVQHTLTSFARVLTGRPDVEVVMSATSNGSTDGKKIYYRPNLALGDSQRHDTALCDRRDPDTGQQQCQACKAREQMMAAIYHEISHIAFNTFIEPGAAHVKDALKHVKASTSDKYADRIMRRIMGRPALPKSYMELANAINPYFAGLVNGLEDVRINERMHEARPGTRAMMDGLIFDVALNGVEGKAETKHWREMHPNHQAGVAAYCYASGYNIEGWFGEEVEVAFKDEQLLTLLTDIKHTRDAHETFQQSFAVFLRLRELGFYELVEEKEQDEQEKAEEEADQPPPQESEDQSESESGSGGDAHDEGGQEDSGEGDSQSSDQGSDVGESGPSDEPSQEEETGEDEEPPSDGGAESESADDDSSDDGESDEGSGNDEDGDADSSSEPGEADAEDDGSGSDSGMGTSPSGGESSEDAGEADEDEDDDASNASAGSSGDPDDAGEDGDADDAGGEGSDEVDGADDSEAEPLDYKPEHGERLEEESGQPVIEPDANAEAEIPDLVDVGLHQTEEPMSLAEENAVETAIIQGIYFEKPSSEIKGVNEWHYENFETDCRRRDWHAWSPRYKVRATRMAYGVDIDPVPETALSPALMRMRIVFAANKRSHRNRNQRAGRIDARVLGKRGWSDDDRLFGRKVVPHKRDYFVLIDLDISGSTMGANLKLIKEAAMAQADLCNRTGIAFAVIAHTGSPTGGDPYATDRDMNLDIYWVKGPDDMWDDKARQKLADLGPSYANLDGHSLEFDRKLLDTRQETDKVILYYSDGAMPAENYTEELQILQREIRTCAQKGYTLLGVGIRTDEPVKHGLPSVRVDSDSDILKVVTQLERTLTA